MLDNLLHPNIFSVLEVAIVVLAWLYYCWASMRNWLNAKAPVLEGSEVMFYGLGLVFLTHVLGPVYGLIAGILAAAAVFYLKNRDRWEQVRQTLAQLEKRWLTGTTR